MFKKIIEQPIHSTSHHSSQSIHNPSNHPLTYQINQQPTNPINQSTIQMDPSTNHQNNQSAIQSINQLPIQLINHFFSKSTEHQLNQQIN